jgi:ABC-2 type transport system ATP-binding protein
LITAENLHRSFGPKEAVKGISFDVAEGEIFGFLGPNGAGKSTTIKILTGQMRPTSGMVEVLGLKIPQERKRLLPLMGVAPEATNLYERLTVRENLDLFCRLYDVPVARSLDLLKKVGLEASARTQVKKLSKGMKQRVLLARAMLHNPRVLFLDEPTSGLDPASAAEINDLLRDINRDGATIFLTTHNMGEADNLCHRVAFLNEGQLQEMGTPADLKRKYGQELVRVTINENGQQAEKTLPLKGAESAALLCDWMSAGQVVSIHSVESDLASIFIKVTGGTLS